MTQLHKFSCAKEILTAANALGIQCELLPKADGEEFIQSVVRKFHPKRTTGHLSIDGESIVIPLEKNEFSYSSNLPFEPVYIFFDQDGFDKGIVLKISEGRALCSVMENAFGMEYFASNRENDYLLAVNWHVIEGSGTAKIWLSQLAEPNQSNSQ